MKSKIFNLLSLSILALVMFMSFASAVTLAEWDLTSDGIATNVDSNVNAGTFTNGLGISVVTFSADGAYADDWSTGALDSTDYFQITLSPDSGYDLSISAINFGERRSDTGIRDYQVKWSKNLDFSSATTIATENVPDDENERDGDITSLSIEVDNGETIYIRWFGYTAEGVSGTWRINDDTLSVEGTVTEVIQKEPEDITECSLLGEKGSELKIKIKDISIIGFGDDEEWLPLDKIEVEVKVENDGDDDIDDIAIEWGLYDLESGDWYVDDEESDFNLKDGDDKVLTFSFNLDDNIDELENGNYVLYVWANAEVDNDTKTEVCISDSEVIEIIIENDFVILYDIESPETVSCGADFQITADVWNIGDSDQDDVSVKVYNSELGINELVTIGDIDEFDSEFLDVFVEIPKDAEEKSYLIRFTVYDEDNDVYENDFDEDESVFTIPLKVEGNCKIDVTAVVSASLESGGKAGEELIIKSIITNSGDKSATYTVNVAGYASWASLDNIDQSTFTLDDGESKEIFITFNVDKDASGDKTFNIEVLSENQLIATQPVSVSIEKSAFSLTDNITENSWLWGIGLLNLILIIAIIVVAVKLARK